MTGRRIANPRTVMVNLRLTEKEVADLDARRQAFTRSEYIRRALFRNDTLNLRSKS